MLEDLFYCLICNGVIDYCMILTQKLSKPLYHVFLGGEKWVMHGMAFLMPLT